ncbi:MAG TPA: AAA domain-containing protein [Ktedonobacterales bacterium]|nr:AAA domain-containing protein [Ktedonobacterales bacterium]
MARVDIETQSAAFFSPSEEDAPPPATVGQSPVFARVARYFHDCFAADARGGVLKDIFEQTDYRVFAEGSETLLTGADARMAVPVKIGIEAQNAADINRRERFLIYGSVFLVGRGQARGRNPGERFCAPLLYYPARIEMEGGRAFMSVSLDEQHVNFPFLSTFIDAESDEQAQAYAEAILAQVPYPPLQDDALRELAGLVGELLPDLDTESLRSFPELMPEEEIRTAMGGPLRLVCASAMMLATRPTEAKGVLTELQLLGQQGATSTPLLAVFDPDTLPQREVPQDDEPLLTSTELSIAQQTVVRRSHVRPLTLVIGPPGTGKSFTTAQLVLDAVARGQTVLISSKMNKAVDVVIDKLQPHLGSQTFILRGGDRSHREEMRGWLNGLLTNTGPQGMPQAARPGEIAMLEDRLRAADDEMDRLRNDIQTMLDLEREWTPAKANLDAFPAPIYAEFAAGQLSPDELVQRYEEARRLEGSTKPLVSWAAHRRGQQQMVALTDLLDIPIEQCDLIPAIADRERARIALQAIAQALDGYGDLNALFTAYARVRDDRGKLVAELLAVRRRDALAQALRHDRRALTAFSTALNAKTDAAQDAIFREMDFRALLRTFPIWAVTNQHVAEFLPLLPELFDLVIIDEASQCDIAGALPLLYRGKRAVVCGDPKQLRHLSFLREDRQRGIATQHGLSAIEREQWNYRTHSLLDAVNQALPTQDDVILLDEHYRSLPQIIEFSNRQFYGGSLRIMSRRPDTIGLRSLELKRVNGKRRKEGYNVEEVEAIVKEIEKIAKAESKRDARSKSSIGILSPYSDQVKYLNKTLAARLKPRLLQEHQIEVGTAHAYQGEERDIMLLSFAVDPTSHHSAIAFLNQQNLFNVSITRARSRQVIFTSLDVRGLPREHLITGYLQYAMDLLEEDVMPASVSRDDFVGEMAQALQEQGYTTFFDYPVAGFDIPLVVTHPNGATIAIECDGIPETQTFPDEIDPVARQAILERAGWQVHRLPYRRWVSDPAGCLTEISGLLGTTEPDEEIS